MISEDLLGFVVSQFLKKQVRLLKTGSGIGHPVCFKISYYGRIPQVTYSTLGSRRSQKYGKQNLFRANVLCMHIIIA